MNNIFSRTLALVVFVVTLAVPAVFAQDFQRNYQVAAGTRVSVHNISGNIDVTGYDGNAIVVTGYKEGRDRDRVDIEDRSTGAAIDVRAKYPEHCNCNASVRFEVKVPRAMSYRYDGFSSISGNVSVRDIAGDLHAKTISGEVSVTNVTGPVNVSAISGDISVGNIAGAVNAKSTSGDVKVNIARLDGREAMEFSSISGDVAVKLPAELDADVEMSTLSGGLKTDFPLQIEKREHGPGQSARGRLGSGARRVKLSTISGDISLTR
ncbi:MAG: DUF4097 family beta strand repeat-containing protein [Blastocatellia bacterium]